MNHINEKKVALTLATLMGGLHLVWSILVALHWAQPLLNFIFKVHMIKAVFLVDDFNLGLALLLIIVTAIIGYVVGYIFATIWNKLHSK